MPHGGAIDAVCKYLMHMLLADLFTKFNLIEVNRIVHISCFNVTVEPDVIGIV